MGVTSSTSEGMVADSRITCRRIHIILTWIRIQDVKKFVTNPVPVQTLIRIRIQAKTIWIRIQQKKD